MNNLRNRILLILGIIAVSLICIFPIQKRINLGLDLKGGMHVVLLVDTSRLDAKAKTDAVPRAIEILRNRIDSLGAAEIVIQRQGNDRILVQLPGITDREKVKKIIGTVANMEFRLVADDANILKNALDGQETKGYVLRYMQDDSQPILLKDVIAVKGDQIQDARVDMDTQGFGQPYVSLSFKGEGSKQFATVTRNNVGRRLAIVLDDKVISAPNIQEAISGGQAQITGQFSYEEASLLALNLRSGALPAPMRIEEERTVGPLLGKDSIDAGIRASVFGIVLVFIFMAIYYRKAGLISWIALLLNLLLILGIM
ncbi:MAG: protein translocase subunit SecD, partial [Candidatus Omnitrophica bacterium CG12_big_fil_rev_8_21_14_0_65_50_5]